MQYHNVHVKYTIYIIIYIHVPCIRGIFVNRNVHVLTLDSDDGRGGDGTTESGSAGVLSSLRCIYLTECEVTGGCLSTSGGVSWGRSYSTRPFPLEIWSTSYSIRQSDRAGEGDRLSSHHRGGGRGGEGDGGWLCSIYILKSNYQCSSIASVPILVSCGAAVVVLGRVPEVEATLIE